MQEKSENQMMMLEFKPAPSGAMENLIEEIKEERSHKQFREKRRKKRHAKIRQNRHEKGRKISKRKRK